MKIELERSDIEAIAEKIAEILGPLISNDKAEDEILDKQALADYLRVDITWIDKNYEGLLPHFHVGKYPRFKKSKIDKWMDSHKPLQDSDSRIPKRLKRAL
jgi:hypothetical protein